MPNHFGCHVMAKPSGSVCNIDCEYCFYLQKEKLYPHRQHNWKMSDDTLEIFIQQYIEAQPGNEVHFAWQGGEPTLLGIDFFRQVVQYCQQYGQAKTISHSFQTNAIALNDEWCQFFKQHHFLIGVSIDGPPDLHDCYRHTRSGKPTHAKVMAGINLLIKHDIEFNTLTVVHVKNAQQPLRVYQYLKDIGAKFLQFIPLVERKPQTESDNVHVLAEPDDHFASVTDWSVAALDYGRFLTAIFDVWVRHDVGRVFIQTFDCTLATWLGAGANICVFAERCGHAFALEANGDLYQCDHYVYPQYRLGNIHQQSIATMNRSEAAIEFGLNKSTHLDHQCQNCVYRFACQGGCPKHRFARGENGLPNHNYLCAGYFHYFQHTEKYMKVMAQMVQKRQPAAYIMQLFR